VGGEGGSMGRAGIREREGDLAWNGGGLAGGGVDGGGKVRGRKGGGVTGGGRGEAESVRCGVGGWGGREGRDKGVGRKMIKCRKERGC